MAEQLKPFPGGPLPKPEPTPKCAAFVQYTDHQRKWRLNKGEAEPFTCARPSVVKIGDQYLCRLHGGHKALEMILAEDTLAQRLDRLLTYPVDTSIDPRGYAWKHDSDTVEYAVELIKEALP